MLFMQYGTSLQVLKRAKCGELRRYEEVCFHIYRKENSRAITLCSQGDRRPSCMAPLEGTPYVEMYSPPLFLRLTIIPTLKFSGEKHNNLISPLILFPKSTTL